MANREYVQEQVVHMVHRALDHANAGTTDSMDEIYRLPVESYRPRSWDEEMNAIFRRLPLVADAGLEHGNARSWLLQGDPGAGRAGADGAGR